MCTLNNVNLLFSPSCSQDIILPITIYPTTLAPPPPLPLPSPPCPTAAVTVEFEEESYTATTAEIYVNISVMLLGNASTPATVRIIGEYEGADGFPTLNFTVEVEPLLPTEVPIFVGVDGVYNPNAKWVLRLEPVRSDSMVVIGQRSQTEISIHETDSES